MVSDHRKQVSKSQVSSSKTVFSISIFSILLNNKNTPSSLKIPLRFSVVLRGKGIDQKKLDLKVLPLGGTNCAVCTQKLHYSKTAICGGCCRNFCRLCLFLISYHSIKLLTFNHCCQTPPRRSSTHPKPVCHFDPLLAVSDINYLALRYVLLS